ncbi:3919_t:CDS:1, partial [Cetraspora pellucida]
MTCRKNYIRGRACTNCKKKKHKCDNEGTQCRYCKKRNLDCVRVVWGKRGRKQKQSRKPNESTFHINDSPAIHSDNKISEQPLPKITHPLSPNNLDEFIDINGYNILPFYFDCYYEEQLAYEQM